jgi:hypothetical protein
MKKVGVISAFYKIFGQSFEKLKQLIFWENDKDIGKTTVDSWRHEPRRSDAWFVVMGSLLIASYHLLITSYWLGWYCFGEELIVKN